MLEEKRKNSNKLSAILSCAMFTIALLTAPLSAQANNKYAAFIMDAETGATLHKKNAGKVLHPASLTKMMTLLMTFDALDKGELSLNSRVHISNHAASMIPSKLGLKPGSTIKVKDAIYALTTKSANDIAVALAEKIGGTEANFAKLMTKKARKLGMRRTRFKNASGLHHPKQISTARDMAKLGRILVTKYKKHYHFFSAKSFTYKGKTYRSHNKLMDTYDGMDGLKTGYIRQSGFNVVTSVVRNDRRLIGVVFGGKSGNSRNKQMAKLLDNAYTKLSRPSFAKNNVPMPQRKPILSAVKVAKIDNPRWNMLNTDNQNSMFNRMIGQGDYDISVRNRIETGLIAISAHKGEDIPAYIFNSKKNLAHSKIKKTRAMKKRRGEWAIQIGAFTSRERTNVALSKSLSKLTSDLRHAKSTIAPTKTAQGWIFRGRLHGYTKESADDACRMLNDCIAIPPSPYQ